MSRLDSLVFLWRRRAYGGSYNLSCLSVSKEVVMSFYVAGVKKRVPKVVSCDMGNTLARLSEDDCHFS